MMRCFFARTALLLVLVHASSSATDKTCAEQHAGQSQPGVSLLQFRHAKISGRLFSGGVCSTGDEVLARWAGNGHRYHATIASIDGSSITVNWDDGDTTHRIIPADDVTNLGTCSGGDCSVGDEVKAPWAANGHTYNATIASIDYVTKMGKDGPETTKSITVNWNDGSASHRIVPASEVIRPDLQKSCGESGGEAGGDSGGLCSVGDEVEALFAYDGHNYHAIIASIDGSSITVDWNDGWSTHRVVPASDVQRDGESCEESGVDDGAGEQGDNVNPSGAAAPLDETGYGAVADRCCQTEMKEFITRQISNLGMEICLPDGLTGIVPYHSCEKGPQSFEALTSNLLSDSASKCAWLAMTGACKPLDPTCPSYAGVAPLADCGCNVSRAVLLDFEKATMVQNNLGGKGPDTGVEEMRFENIGEYPAEQPFELVVTTNDRYEVDGAKANGLKKYPKFGNIGVNAPNFPEGFSGEITLKLSFVKPGTSTPVVLPEVFFAVFDIDGLTDRCYQTLAGKGYTGYVTDVNTELSASRTGDGRTRFTAPKNKRVDSPTDPMTATDDQRQHMVMYFYTDVSDFEFTFGMLGTCTNSRNFNFAGKSALMDRCAP